jgi:hypothetical protein
MVDLLGQAGLAEDNIQCPNIAVALAREIEGAMNRYKDLKERGRIDIVFRQLVPSCTKSIQS